MELRGENMDAGKVSAEVNMEENMEDKILEGPEAIGICIDEEMGTGIVEAISNYQLAEFAKEYEKLMLVYENGIKQIVTKFEILNNEYKAMGDRNPIESIKSRLKSPKSIYVKLRRKGLPVTARTLSENLSDIAGVRVICSYISDIYNLRDMLLCHKDIRLIREKDYIKNPKSNGYRSLHLIVETTLCMSDGEYPVKVEIQLRTIAMDFWASLEHEIRYKSSDDIPEMIQDDLHECAEIIAMTDRRMERIRKQVDML